MLAEQRLSKIAEIIPKWEQAEGITLISLSFSDAGERAEYLAHQPGGKPAKLQRDAGRLHWIIEELREELNIPHRGDCLLIHRSERRPVYVVDYRDVKNGRCVGMLQREVVRVD